MSERPSGWQFGPQLDSLREYHSSEEPMAPRAPFLVLVERYGIDGKRESYCCYLNLLTRPIR